MNWVQLGTIFTLMETLQQAILLYFLHLVTNDMHWNLCLLFMDSELNAAACPQLTLPSKQ
jgi:hypothetical protein